MKVSAIPFLARALFSSIAVAVLAAAPAHAQEATAEAAIRDFLENSMLQMRLEEGSWMPINTDTLEFLPAARVIAGGGIVVSGDLAESKSAGVPYEPWQWTLRSTSGAPSLTLIRVQDGEPTITLEGTMSGFDGERVDVELRGSAPGRDGNEPIVVRASLIALKRLAPGVRERQWGALAGTWTLQRFGERDVTQVGIPPITYTFDPDGSFAVEAEDGMIDSISGLKRETLRGRWGVTGMAWTRPPFEGDYENGPLLILFGDEPAPDVFMILEQSDSSLALKMLEPSFITGEMSWFTLYLRR